MKQTKSASSRAPASKIKAMPGEYFFALMVLATIALVVFYCVSRPDNIRLKVNVYTVGGAVSQGGGLSWGLFWGDLNKNGVQVVGGEADTITAHMPITLENYSALPEGSRMFLAALSKMGPANHTVSTTVVTPRGQKVPISIGDKVSHIKSYTVTFDGNSPTGTTLELVPGVVTEGGNFIVYPEYISRRRDYCTPLLGCLI